MSQSSGLYDRVVGLDPSNTSFGVAAFTAEPIGPYPQIVTWALRFTTIAGPERLAKLRNHVAAVTDGAALVTLEGYSPGSKNAREACGEIGGVIRVMLWEQGTPYVVIQPSSMKKYATGSGAASKLAVHDAAIHRSGREFATMDESDAFWLLQMALAHLGLPHIEMPKPNRAVLDRIAWPAPRVLEARP